MSAISTREPGLPPSWGAVLDQVQQSLTLALERAEQRLQVLDAAANVAVPEASAALAQQQARCAAGRRQLDASVVEADRQVQDADAALAVAEETLRSWLHACAAAQRTLAERATRAVG